MLLGALDWYVVAVGEVSWPSKRHRVRRLVRKTWLTHQLRFPVRLPGLVAWPKRFGTLRAQSG